MNLRNDGILRKAGDAAFPGGDPTGSESVESLRRHVEASLDQAIAMLDVEGRITGWNPGAERQRLCPTADAIGRHFSEFFLPADAELGKPTLELESAVKNGESVSEDWRRRMDGSRFRARTVLTALRDADGALQGFLEVARDISSEYEARERLLESEARLAAILNSAREGIVTTNAEETILSFNPAAARMFGCSVEEALGRSLDEFLTGREVDFDKGQDLVPATGIRRGGERFVAEASFSQFEAEGETRFGIVVRDVTARLQAEEKKHALEIRMMEGQRLESLGILAGGVAHDFNNLLAGILGNASLGRRRLDPDSPIREYFVNIEESGNRAAELCRQMLAYSGKGHFVVTPVDLGNLVRSSLELLRATVRRKIALQLDLSGRLPAVMADADQIRQVLLNLVMNASDAIGTNTGKIRISTGLVREGTEKLVGEVAAPDLPDGPFVWIEVQDTGCGMSEEMLTKIFEPFYSSKFPGRGLGLAAVHGIVRGHKGVLQVRSKPGEGSSFRLLLPATDSAAEWIAPPTEPAREWRGSGEVLVVDDEETVRFVTVEMLESAGFHATSAYDGENALAQFREDPGRWSLVLLDLTMPRLDGVETHRELHRIRPDVPVLLMSGFSENEAIGRFEGARIAGFIQKPFRTSQLLEKVRQAIEPRS